MSLIPFLLPVIAAAVGAGFAWSAAGRRRWKGVAATFGTAVAVAVLGMAVVGLPGALVYELAAPWVRLLLGEGYADLGDAAWPAAILITLTWPFSFVLAYVAVHGPLDRAGRLVRSLAWIAVPYACGVLLALWAHRAS